MKCARCPRDVEKLFTFPGCDGPVCGCCQISLARQFPGVHGFAYSGNQVNPKEMDEVKEIDATLKAFSDHPDPRQRFTDQEAATIHAVWERDQIARKKFEATVGKKALQAESEAVEAEAEVQQSNIEHAQKESKRELRKMQPLFNEWKKEVTSSD